MSFAKRAVILAIGISGVTAPFAAYAAQVSADQSVSILVPQSLSFSGSTSQINLTFPDSTTGSETNAEAVTYTVKANNVSRQNGVIQARLEENFENINFMASVGGYNKEGGTGSLVATQSGYVTVAKDPVNLCDRNIDSSNGKILQGSIPISYKAVATDELSPGNTTKSLIISFTDN